ncbi:hypothetical protein SISSUDRAFT_1027300 [Sistotremastrum suecicum HHB10207 ss-3]|uniref:J domain-containing protein n=1 Tax=Sistotremastrum suecicum HHB10207 ss-3 TaxID=1314776 RepID=A0A165Z2B7_9AGAM|nr:hypothetical protein SISSUDRAFT_1027300 [Sistotremastrum suecicum HHB10207 ss-3]
MAQYHYDEAGNMAAYFVLTFLSLVLVPLSFSYVPTTKKAVKAPPPACECSACVDHREALRKRSQRPWYRPQIGTKALFTLGGWVVFGLLVYKIATTVDESKMYDPFQILGVSLSATEQEIKRHYKKLSIKFHPDKVKLSGNDTLDSVAERFVELTKAYKALTNEEIRKNWEQYGHPDGRQEMSMGIAIPLWIIESKNNIWVLGVYGLVFGGALPLLVGRWWFGSRSYTKDGVHAKTAESFFKTLREESTLEDTIRTLATAWKFEKQRNAVPSKPSSDQEINRLAGEISSRSGQQWTSKSDDALTRRALVLMWSHLLRIPVKEPLVQKEQENFLVHSQVLLTSLLNITLSRNWLNTSVHVIHLSAYLTQALAPSSDPNNILLQLPGVTSDDLKELPSRSGGQIESFIGRLKEKEDSRVANIEAAAKRWGHLDVVDVSYKVLGERIIPAGSFVNLVMKLRVVPPLSSPEVSKKSIVPNSAASVDAEEAFLQSRKEADDLPQNSVSPGAAHAPFYPASRRPQWWAILCDDKLGKVIVPPVKIVDVPFATGGEKDYRTYKTQFQAPNQVGSFVWKVLFVSDTFVGEDVSADATLNLEDPAKLEEQLREDEISDPEEDSLAGQMALMKGGSVKRASARDESDDESTTDGEQEEADSSSDSD